jgi:hypothetical protein
MAYKEKSPQTKPHLLLLLLLLLPINLDRPWKVFLQAPPGNNKSLIVPKFSIDDDNDDLGNALRAPKAFDEENYLSHKMARPKCRVLRT